MNMSIPLGLCQCGCGGKTALIQESHPSRGQVVGQSRLCLPGHHVRRILRDVFYRYAIRGDNCWDWNGPRTTEGYGRLNFYGRKFAAHRASYEIHVGKIPAGMLVCHKCDVPRCVNPGHLYLGDHAANVHDAIRKGRLPHGEKHWNSKLTDADVDVIRRTFSAGGTSHSELALRFGVTRETISQIINGRSRVHSWPDTEAAATLLRMSPSEKMRATASRLRTVPVKLFKADWDRLSALADSAGTTPTKLARDFILRRIRRRSSSSMRQPTTPESPGFKDMV